VVFQKIAVCFHRDESVAVVKRVGSQTESILISQGIPEPSIGFRVYFCFTDCKNGLEQKRRVPYVSTGFLDGCSLLLILLFV
jgi:hypothetical protein